MEKDLKHVVVEPSLVPSSLTRIMQKRKYVLGLTGKANAGKDTVADIVAEKSPCVRLSFADPIKRACAILYDVPLENFYDRNLKEVKDERHGISPREMCQFIGTDVMRKQVDLL